MKTQLHSDLNRRNLWVCRFSEAKKLSILLNWGAFLVWISAIRSPNIVMKSGLRLSSGCFFTLFSALLFKFVQLYSEKTGVSVCFVWLTKHQENFLTELGKTLVSATFTCLKPKKACSYKKTLCLNRLTWNEFPKKSHKIPINHYRNRMKCVMLEQKPPFMKVQPPQKCCQ